MGRDDDEEDSSDDDDDMEVNDEKAKHPSVTESGRKRSSAPDMTPEGRKRGKTDSKTTTPSATPTPKKKSASAVSTPSSATHTPVSLQYATSLREFLKSSGGKAPLAAVGGNVRRPPNLSKKLKAFVMERPSEFKLSSDGAFIELVENSDRVGN